MFAFLIVSVVLLTFLYLRKLRQCWKNRGFVSTSPNLIFGDTGKSVRGKKLISFVLEDIYKKYPNERYVGYYEFLKPNLLIRDPQLIETILVKDFSTFTDRIWFSKNVNNIFAKNIFMMREKQWKTLRTKLIPAFSTSKLNLMLPLMERCSQVMETIIKEKCKEEAIDMKEIATQFSTDVIGCCVFGLQFNTLMEPESEYRRIMKKMTSPTVKMVSIGILRMILPKLVALLKLSEWSSDIEDFYSNLLRQSEEFRQKESFRRNDLMQSLLDIRDRDRAQSKECSDEDIVDDDVVISNILIFYSAGLETTAASIAFCLYELSLNPEYQQRLRDEIFSLLKANKNLASYETLKKMTYAEMVISETLRKYPPVGLLARVCTKPYQLPESSLQLNPGDRITIPVNALHYDEKYYPNPNTFDPERFTPENIAARPSFTYLPFGDGPRICIAFRFAKMEMKLCLARLISKYQFTVCSKTDIPLEMHPRILLLTPKNGVHLQVRELKPE